MTEAVVVAVIGLSGVGKSTLLAEVAEPVNFEHLQASILIKMERSRRQRPFDHDLRHADIDENQSLLIEGFHRVICDLSGLVVLDGHTVVDTEQGLVEIDPEVFQRIGVSKFIVLAEDPEEICRRRVADRTRERPNRSADELRGQQERSIIVAHRASLMLRAPMVILVGATGPELAEELSR